MARVGWNARKRMRVLASRGVDFVDAAGIFDGPTIAHEDKRRDYGEKRYIALGKNGASYFYVVYTVRQDGTSNEDLFHIITAWRAGRRARDHYNELYPR